MSNSDAPQDQDLTIALFSQQLEEEDQTGLSDDLMAELDAIGRDEPSATVPQQLHTIRVPNATFGAPDPNDPDVIMAKPRLTNYDRANQKVRELETELNALPHDFPPAQRLQLEWKLETALKARARAQSDVGRRNERIDAYRAGPGREVYNASRRKVRTQPNADLSAMTPKQKRQYRNDQIADSKWLARQRKKGVSEPEIQRGLAERIANREQQRREEEELQSNPDFGRF